MGTLEESVTLTPPLPLNATINQSGEISVSGFLLHYLDTVRLYNDRRGSVDVFKGPF